ncbi:flagellar biosynthetic protein FliP [Pelomonas saccharophila]|uniref:Flagellar biosynthetic protein FliP n=1 Tax=Roseateles saccharophilus TaxID=304 RepID=A0ABU1YJ24_ROSSA|nr:flagellar type III secretion system pore protein FliP [Roseateles saccharophilus]MDR7268206.1 flagellar biosynthetic protein FliP [Roseateles saccharophilus]
MKGLRLFAAVALLGAGAAWAAGTPPSPWNLAEQGAQSPEMASALRIFLGLTALSFIPAALVCMTCFVRIVVVLSMLRHAIGLMESPPNVVIIILALFLTLFSMQPVLQRLNDDAVQPYLAGKVKMAAAADRGVEPLKEFMVRQTREQDLGLMIELANAERPQSLADVSMLHLIPAFMLSELRTAFQIGFIIFLPFLLIDLVVASALMALGMMMVPPTTVSVPLKLLLFVLIDGWNIVTRSLLGTIH